LYLDFPILTITANRNLSIFSGDETQANLHTNIM